MSGRSNCWLFSLAILVTTSCAAQGLSWPVRAGNGIDFAKGFLVGYAAHELGHLAVARAKGLEIGLRGPSIVYSGGTVTPAQRLQLATAGFQVQWLMSEAVLRSCCDGRRPSAFEAGIVGAHIAISFAYPLLLKNHRHGDVVSISRATGYSTSRIALALAIPAVLDAWRLFGEDVPAWVPALSLSAKALGLVWIWRY